MGFIWFFLGCIVGFLFGMALTFWICDHDKTPTPPDPGLGFGNL